MEEDAAVYFRVDTTEGEKYLCYRPGQDLIQVDGPVLCFGLEIDPDGQWHTISRDLAEDLRTALPSSQILSVKDFYVFGSIKVDDLKLINPGK